MNIFENERERIENRMNQIIRDKEEAGMDREITIAGGVPVLVDQSEEYLALKHLLEIIETKTTSRSNEYLEEREKTQLPVLSSSEKSALSNIEDNFKTTSTPYEEEQKRVITLMEDIERDYSANPGWFASAVAKNGKRVLKSSKAQYDILVDMSEMLSNADELDYSSYMDLRSKTDLSPISEEELQTITSQNAPTEEIDNEIDLPKPAGAPTLNSEDLEAANHKVAQDEYFDDLRKEIQEQYTQSQAIEDALLGSPSEQQEAPALSKEDLEAANHKIAQDEYFGDLRKEMQKQYTQSQAIDDALLGSPSEQQEAPALSKEDLEAANHKIAQDEYFGDLRKEIQEQYAESQNIEDEHIDSSTNPSLTTEEYEAVNRKIAQDQYFADLNNEAIKNYGPSGKNRETRIATLNDDLTNDNKNTDTRIIPVTNNPIKDIALIENDGQEELYEVVKVTPWEWVKAHKKQILIALGLTALAISAIVLLTNVLPALAAATAEHAKNVQIANMLSMMNSNSGMWATANAAEQAALHSSNIGLASAVSNLTGKASAFSAGPGTWSFGGQTMTHLSSVIGNNILASEKAIAALVGQRDLTMALSLLGLGTTGIGLSIGNKSKEYKSIARDIKDLAKNGNLISEEEIHRTADRISGNILVSETLSQGDKNILLKKLQRALKKLQRNKKFNHEHFISANFDDIKLSNNPEEYERILALQNEMLAVESPQENDYGKEGYADNVNDYSKGM